jgi:hypothetical protein
MSEGQNVSIGGTLRSVREELRTWPWWMRNNGRGAGKEIAPWQKEIPGQVISLLLELAVCQDLNEIPTANASPEEIARHFKDCGTCRTRLVSAIEGLQYFHHLIS